MVSKKFSDYFYPAGDVLDLEFKFLSDRFEWDRAKLEFRLRALLSKLGYELVIETVDLGSHFMALTDYYDVLFGGVLGIVTEEGDKKQVTLKLPVVTGLPYDYTYNLSLHKAVDFIIENTPIDESMLDSFLFPAISIDSYLSTVAFFSSILSSVSGGNLECRESYSTSGALELSKVDIFKKGIYDCTILLTVPSSSLKTQLKELIVDIYGLDESVVLEMLEVFNRAYFEDIYYNDAVYELATFRVKGEVDKFYLTVPHENIEPNPDFYMTFGDLENRQGDSKLVDSDKLLSLVVAKNIKIMKTGKTLDLFHRDELLVSIPIYENLSISEHLSLVYLSDIMDSAYYKHFQFLDNFE